MLSGPNSALVATADYLWRQGGETAVRVWLEVLQQEHGALVSVAEWDMASQQRRRARQYTFADNTLTLVIQRRSRRAAAARNPQAPRFDLNPLTAFVILAACIGIVCAVIAHRLTRPLRRLQQTARALAAGELTARANIACASGEIGQLSRDFDAMAERLTQLLQGQKRLLRDVSHELRSPLARIQIALALAAKRGTGNQSELARIERETNQLEGLIAQLLQLQRLEVGEPQPWQPFCVKELLEHCVADVNFEGHPRHVRVTVNVTGSLPTMGDRGLFASAITNVLRNALRYSPDHGVIWVEGKRHLAVNEIVIRDQGPGVAAEHLEKLFEPFYRVSEAREREGGGHGLGLAIAQQALRHHGGLITAHNGKGGGFIVTLRWPIVSGTANPLNSQVI